MFRRHSGDNSRVGVEHGAVDRPVRSAQIDGRHAKIGNSLGNFFVFDARNDAVAFPGTKEFGDVFRQTALNVQDTPSTVRTHIRRNAQQASTAICPGAFDQQHHSFAISSHVSK
jgi:hypothetical protein